MDRLFQMPGLQPRHKPLKRSAACFGLGRYLYYFAGVWVDLDERKRPTTVPHLPPWATPAGWIRGLRPKICLSLARWKIGIQIQLSPNRTRA